MKFLFSPSFILALYVICIFTPIVYSYYLIVPFCLALLFQLLTIRKFIKDRNPLLIIFTAITVWAIFYKLIGFSTAEWGNYSSYIMIVVTIWSGIYMWHYAPSDHRKILFLVFLISIVTNLIYAIEIRVLYPEIDVTMKETEEAINLYGRLNIGSTEYTYCVLFASLFCFIAVFKIPYEKWFLPKWILAILFILFSYYLITYGYSATALLSFFGAIAGFLFFIKGKEGLAILFSLLIVILFFVGTVYDKEIVSFISDVAGEKIGTRVSAILHISSGQADNDEKGLFSRITMIWFDIKIWLSTLESFVFGWGYHTNDVGPNDVLENMIRNKCGNHSAIFDVLPRYGLIGLTVAYYAMFFYWRYLKKTFCNIPKEIITILFILIVFNNIMNKILAYNILFILFFVYPFLSHHVKVQKNTSDNK